MCQTSKQAREQADYVEHMRCSRDFEAPLSNRETGVSLMSVFQSLGGTWNQADFSDEAHSIIWKRVLH
jgi:hypothetical protein